MSDVLEVTRFDSRRALFGDIPNLTERQSLAVEAAEYAITQNPERRLSALRIKKLRTWSRKPGAAMSVVSALAAININPPAPLKVNRKPVSKPAPKPASANPLASTLAEPLPTRIGCPRPDKYAWLTEDGADMHVKLMREAGRPLASWLHSYECDCGYWHIGKNGGLA